LTFPTQSNLIKHMERVHGLKKRSYGCTWSGCDKGFVTRSGLTMHLRKHDGYKKYTCRQDGCGKKFASKGGMDSHYLTHFEKKNYYVASEFPFVCKICKKALLTEENWKYHCKLTSHKINTKDFLDSAADINCDKFTDDSVDDDDDDDEVSCEICDERFETEKKLKNHYKTNNHKERAKAWCDEAGIEYEEFDSEDSDDDDDDDHDF